jgi:hypothetical protein
MIDDYTLCQLLGSGFDYEFLPVIHLRGGILVAWKAAEWSASCISIRSFSISVRPKCLEFGLEWWLTSVYGPSHDADKPPFLAELHDLRLLRPGPWLLAGGFNLIYRVEDKNNDRLNRWRMGQLQRFINEAGLKEIHLFGGLFTWSNEWAHPTLERIDRAFISWEWDELYPASDL